MRVHKLAGVEVFGVVVILFVLDGLDQLAATQIPHLRKLIYVMEIQQVIGSVRA